jgi:1-acyl-sn-glycerol-3-phosphate acyltransferase
MRAKVHRFFETKNQNPEYKKVVKEEIKKIILTELENDLK